MRTAKKPDNTYSAPELGVGGMRSLGLPEQPHTDYVKQPRCVLSQFCGARIRVSGGHVVNEALGRLLPTPSQLPAVAVTLWCSVASSCVLPVSASVITWPCPLYVFKDTSHTG